MATSSDARRAEAIVARSLNDPASDDVLMLLAELDELPCTDRIYLLHARDLLDGTLNQHGGTPRGVSRARWPRGRGGSPMQHLCTFDVATLPPLGAYLRGARAVALFMAEGAASSFRAVPGELEVEWVGLDGDDLATPPLDDPPAPPIASARGIGVVPAMVPPALWATPDWNAVDARYGPDSFRRAPLDCGLEAKLEQLEAALLQIPARVGGEAIWIQEPVVRGEILLQFNDRFVDVNLGDCGWAYCFGDVTLFQDG